MYYKNREQLIQNIILDVVDSESKIRLIDIVDSETGEIIEEGYPVNKKVIEDDRMLRKSKCAQPYFTCTSNKKIREIFLEPLGNADFRRVSDLMYSIDIYGRLKYGDNIKQYCRSYEDIGKIVKLDGKPLQRFIKTIRDLQIIRIITVDKGCNGQEQFISFNPAIAVNGVYWDRELSRIWVDIIKEYNLLPDKVLKKLLKE